MGHFKDQTISFSCFSPLNTSCVVSLLQTIEYYWFTSFQAAMGFSSFDCSMEIRGRSLMPDTQSFSQLHFSSTSMAHKEWKSLSFQSTSKPLTSFNTDRTGCQRKSWNGFTHEEAGVKCYYAVTVSAMTWSQGAMSHYSALQYCIVQANYSQQPCFQQQAAVFGKQALINSAPA